MQLIDLGIMLQKCFIEVFLDRENPGLLLLLFELDLLKSDFVR